MSFVQDDAAKKAVSFILKLVPFLSVLYVYVKFINRIPPYFRILIISNMSSTSFQRNPRTIMETTVKIKIRKRRQKKRK